MVSGYWRPGGCWRTTATFQKVIREWRPREQKAGTPLSVAEKDHWMSAMSDFFTPAEPKQGAKKRAIPTLFKEPSRQAALDWMRAVDNQLRSGLGKRL